MKRNQINPSTKAIKQPFERLLSDDLKHFNKSFEINSGGDLVISADGREVFSKRIKKLIDLAKDYENLISQLMWNERARIDRDYENAQDSLLAVELSKPNTNVVLLDTHEVPFGEGA